MLPKQVNFYYWGPVFRREKPQAGRYRQFNQLGYEVLGDSSPVIDAQLIVLTYNLLQKLGLREVSIQINSIGTAAARKIYKQELLTYYRNKRKLLCQNCKKRLTK